MVGPGTKSYFFIGASIIVLLGRRIFLQIWVVWMLITLLSRPCSRSHGRSFWKRVLPFFQPKPQTTEKTEEFVHFLGPKNPAVLNGIQVFPNFITQSKLFFILFFFNNFFSRRKGVSFRFFGSFCFLF